MRRRAFLRRLGACAAVAASGCLGGGGEVVATVSRSITVEPGGGWIEEVPDVSEPGGAVAYTVRSEDGPFDVYFFVEESAVNAYRAFLEGDRPDETPRGHSQFSKSAVGADDGMYEAATDDGGAREPLDATGPYHFVLDHSSYRLENRVDDAAEPLSAFVDLTVVRNHAGL